MREPFGPVDAYGIITDGLRQLADDYSEARETGDIAAMAFAVVWAVVGVLLLFVYLGAIVALGIYIAAKLNSIHMV